MPIIYQKWITRVDLQANPSILYVFGDNVQRKGMGGQAKEMRGEPNAVGIATKWKPTISTDAFFSDQDIEEIQDIQSNDLLPVLKHLQAKGTVIWPLDGIGTGLSKLPEQAPKVWKDMEKARKKLETI